MKRRKKIVKKIPRTKVGRDRHEINLKMVENLAKIHCTHDEIAAVLGCSKETLFSHGQDYVKAFEKGWLKGKKSLRRFQWMSAKDGNVQMQIWLGKQLLGQRDQVVQHQALPEGMKEVDQPDLKSLSVKELEQLATIIKKATPKPAAQ